MMLAGGPRQRPNCTKPFVGSDNTAAVCGTHSHKDANGTHQTDLMTSHNENGANTDVSSGE